ncbi:MAG: beta-ketothiolase BktB [Hyphomicrobiales bacterium]|nr:beta-ketothiolase BktB [Hyphomicrobiales bacterium]
MTREVFITSGVRTAIGIFQGALSNHPPTALATHVVREAMARSQIDGLKIDHVVFGHVINTEPRDMYLARVAAIEGGVSPDTPALTLNRLCGSGLQAIISASQSILLGDANIAIAGGAEVMSRGPHSSFAARVGTKMGELVFHDMMTGVLTDPFGAGHMGITAENVAQQFNISRAEQDALAVESQRRAAMAITEGRFHSQIVPVDVKRGRETVAFTEDEYPKSSTTLDMLSALRAAFQKDGTVTAGNASGINDGAAAVVLMSEQGVRDSGVKPMARLLGYSHAGVDPSLMGIGPVPAVRKLLGKLTLTPNDFDVIESNEAFAAQACAVARELNFPAERVNPNGGAIALGHPIGATGAILVVKALYELERIGGRRALCTMCIGGGQGVAFAIERLN